MHVPVCLARPFPSERYRPDLLQDPQTVDLQPCPDQLAILRLIDGDSLLNRGPAGGRDTRQRSQMRRLEAPAHADPVSRRKQVFQLKPQAGKRRDHPFDGLPEALRPLLAARADETLRQILRKPLEQARIAS